MEKKTSNTLLIVLAIVAALLAAFNAYVALQQVSDLTRITGYQVLYGNRSTGNVTLSIPMNVQIYFDPNYNLINWSNGSVIEPGPAILTTSRAVAAQVQSGTWENNTGKGRDSGLLLRNVGNINVSINLTANKNWSTLFIIPGAGYDFNITENETGTCGPRGGITFGLWNAMGQSPGQSTIICENMSFLNNMNELRIDIRLTLPLGVARTDYSSTITASGVATG